MSPRSTGPSTGSLKEPVGTSSSRHRTVRTWPTRTAVIVPLGAEAPVPVGVLDVAVGVLDVAGMLEMLECRGERGPVGMPPSNHHRPSRGGTDRWLVDGGRLRVGRGGRHTCRTASTIAM
ncbi:hypothetical protein CITRIK5_20147 [Citricoccus sp. K5]|nr:hypothetical protein CITRIK5_20147 [Citricoccus sp. K5]